MKIGVLWDLDGTLLDTLEDLADAVNHALTQKGYPLRSYKEIRDFVGYGAMNLIRKAVPEGTDEAQIQSTLEAFRSYYFHNSMVKTGPFAGVTDALNAVAAKYPVAIVSNKPHPAVVELCRQFFPGISALGETPDLPRKPAPDMLRHAMMQLGVEACIYIGDSEVDILTAKNAGVPCLSVLWGFRDADVLAEAGATHLCREPSQIANLIDSMVKELF